MLDKEENKAKKDQKKITMEEDITDSEAQKTG